MPGKPEDSKEEKQESVPEENNASQEQQEQPVVREVTQTDRLNKKLLSSLLERMNSKDSLTERFSTTEDQPESSNSTDQDEFAP